MDNVAVNALQEAKKIILDGLKGYKVRVFLFGSRATGKAGPASDIDVAVDPQEDLPPGVLSAIREELDESGIPFSVELVDLKHLDRSWLANVEKDGVLWKD